MDELSVTRNIRLAKKARERGEGHWKRCRLARYLQDGNKLKKIVFTCDEVRFFSELWKKEFREKNLTDAFLKAGLPDRAYESFCNEIDEFLNNCKCKPRLVFE
jgi:hypothetical protein